MRGHNIGGNSGTVATVPGKLEEAAFDELGPMTRLAIAESPLKILAFPIAKQLLDRGLDPCMPALDSLVADGVRLLAYQLMAADRSPEDARAGLVPLRRKHRR